MAETKLTKVEKGPTKVRNVPIAVTPEGFWCCPAPVMFPKALKTSGPLNKPKLAPPAPKNPVPKKQAQETEKKQVPLVSRSEIGPDDQRKVGTDEPVFSATLIPESATKPKTENVPRKVSIEFGEPGTSDIKVVLLGNQGFTVKLSTHKSVLVESSGYFANRITEHQPLLPILEIDDCEDVEIYVETVGLMYCKEIKQRLIKQSVSRVLRILKVIFRTMHVISFSSHVYCNKFC